MNTDENGRYFILKANGLLEEYFSLEDCIDKPYKLFIAEAKFREYFTPPFNGKPHPVSDYIFYSNTGYRQNLQLCGWAVKKIYVFYMSSSKIQFDIIIADPTKRTKPFKCEIKRQYVQPTDIEVILYTWNKLVEWSRLHDWEQHDMMSKNEQLISENAKLKKQIEELNRNTIV
jgi:hypothetical protein